MRLSEFETVLITHTERFLTWRKRRRLRRKEKQKRKNQILDWIQALLWAAVVVLIINQYLVQAYAVPSGSMEDTIMGEDRLFVDKIVYGPELVPGFGKLPALAQAKRGDIVVFLNPDYQKEMGRDVSWAEELFNRLVYMLTLTLINRDKNPDGTDAKHFLVKRLIAQPGERIRMRDGRVEIREIASGDWTSEEELQARYEPLSYRIQKKFYPFSGYPAVKENVIQQTYLQGGAVPDALAPGLDARYIVTFCGPRVQEPLSPDKPDIFEYFYFQIVLEAFGKYDHRKEAWSYDKIRTEYQRLMLSRFGRRMLDLAGMSDAEVSLQYQKMILAYNRLPPARINAMSKEETAAAFQAAPVKYLYIFLNTRDAALYTDDYFEDLWLNYAKLSQKPYDTVARNRYERRALGWYIPPDRFFPMGDNRDNSRDARYFGAVKTSNLLGKSLFRFWPLNRLGPVY